MPRRHNLLEQSLWLDAVRARFRGPCGALVPDLLSAAQVERGEAPPDAMGQDIPKFTIGRAHAGPPAGRMADRYSIRATGSAAHRDGNRGLQCT
jgi:hypothetical protein